MVTQQEKLAQEFHAKFSTPTKQEKLAQEFQSKFSGVVSSEKSSASSGYSKNVRDWIEDQARIKREQQANEKRIAEQKAREEAYKKALDDRKRAAEVLAAQRKEQILRQQIDRLRNQNKFVSPFVQQSYDKAQKDFSNKLSAYRNLEKTKPEVIIKPKQYPTISLPTGKKIPISTKVDVGFSKVKSNVLGTIDRLFPTDEKGVIGLFGLDRNVIPKASLKLETEEITTDLRPFTLSGKGTIMTSQRMKTFFEKFNLDPNDKNAITLKNNVERIQNNYENENISQTEAQKQIESASKIYTSAAIKSGLPKTFAEGVVFALLQATPIAPVINTYLSADMIIKRKAFLNQLKEYPVETGLQVGAFALGAKAGNYFISEGISFDKSGRIKVNAKKIINDLKKAGKGVEGVAEWFFLKGMPKSKRGSFSSAAQILEKLYKKKKTKKIKTLQDALDLLKTQDRNSRIRTIKYLMKEQQIRYGSITSSFYQRLRTFMNKAGIRNRETASILGEIQRQQFKIKLDWNFKNGLINQAEYLSGLKKLKLLKQKLISFSKVSEIQPSKVKINFTSKFGQLQKVFVNLKNKLKTQLTSSEMSKLIQQLSIIQKQLLKLKQGQKVSQSQKQRIIQFQRQLQKLRQSDKFKQRQKQAQKQFQKQSQKQKQRQRLNISQKQKQRLKQKQKQAQRQLYRTRQKLKQKLSPKQKQKQRQLLRLQEKRVYKLKLKLKQRKKEPKKRSEIIKRKKISKQKPKEAFNIYGKSGKRFLKLNLKPLAKNDALSLGTYAIDNTTSKQLRLVPVGKTKRLGKIRAVEKNYFNRNKKKLRPFKIRGKKTIIIKPRYIEKTKYGIDTRGEKKGLKIAKFIKQRNSHLNNRKINVKRVIPKRIKKFTRLPKIKKKSIRLSTYRPNIRKVIVTRRKSLRSPPRRIIKRKIIKTSRTIKRSKVPSNFSSRAKMLKTLAKARATRMLNLKQKKRGRR